MVRSAMRFGVSVSVEVLFPGVGSVVPVGGVTVAVLTRLPVNDEIGRAAWRETTEMPAPLAISTVTARLLPDPVAPLVTLAVPLVGDVQVPLVRPAGSVSAMVAPITLLGPLLVTVIV